MVDATRNIRARAKLGVITATLNDERYAVEDALRTPDGFLLSGASRVDITHIIDAGLDLCASLFAH